jgi:hypothetical protein
LTISIPIKYPSGTQGECESQKVQGTGRTAQGKPVFAGLAFHGEQQAMHDSPKG